MCRLTSGRLGRIVAHRQPAAADTGLELDQRVYSRWAAVVVHPSGEASCWAVRTGRACLEAAEAPGRCELPLGAVVLLPAFENSPLPSSSPSILRVVSWSIM